MIQIGYKYKIVPSFFWQVLCKRCNPYYETEKGKSLTTKSRSVNSAFEVILFRGGQLYAIRSIIVYFKRGSCWAWIIPINLHSRESIKQTKDQNGPILEIGIVLYKHYSLRFRQSDRAEATSTKENWETLDEYSEVFSFSLFEMNSVELHFVGLGYLR